MRLRGKQPAGARALLEVRAPNEEKLSRALENVRSALGEGGVFVLALPFRNGHMLTFRRAGTTVGLR